MVDLEKHLQDFSDMMDRQTYTSLPSNDTRGRYLRTTSDKAKIIDMVNLNEL